MDSLQPQLSALRDRLGPSPIAGLVAGIHHLQYVVAPGRGIELVTEFLARTGYGCSGCFRHRDSGDRHYLLRLAGSPIGIVVVESATGEVASPRLQGLAFRVRELEPVRRLLQSEQVPFAEHPPGLVTGLIPGLDSHFAYVAGEGFEWFQDSAFTPADSGVPASGQTLTPVSRVTGVDHIAYRIRLQDFQAAAAHLMRLTPYRFTDCYTIGQEKAETMVFRTGDLKPALVASYGQDPDSVVWQYVAKHGPRVHHVAYYAEDVLTLVRYQKSAGIQFTTPEIIGSPERGIYQIFTTPSASSREITEYIERFGGFAGFFDPGNVGDLMASTRPFS